MCSAFRRVTFLLCLLLAFVPQVVLGQSTDQPTAKAILFYSPTCPHCVEVLEHVLPPLQAAYGDQLEIRFYNLTEPFAVEVYSALHQYAPDLPTGVPQLYIGQSVLVGSDQIRDRLPPLIDACLSAGGCDWPFTYEPAAATPAPEPTAAANPVYLAYCFDPTCLECERVTYELNALQKQYPNLVVERFNIRDDALIIEAMCERYQVPVDDRLKAPAVFIGEEYLALEAITLPRLTALVEDAGAVTSSPPWEGLDSGSASASIAERFGSFSVLAVALAGLLDGINPCAFTTIIFFVSYLALVGRGKREILLVGTAFTSAVFLAYLVMGLGLSAIIERMGSVASIGRIIYGGTALVCLTLAVLSLSDYFKIRQGRLNDISLQLPSALKKRIHQTIRTHSRMRGTVAAAFGRAYWSVSLSWPAPVRSICRRSCS